MTTQTTTNNGTKNNRPTHSVRYRFAEDDYRDIGVAWADDEGNLSLKMDGTPLNGWDGRLYLRTIKAKGEATEQAA